jgi:zinc transporter ZupT
MPTARRRTVLLFLALLPLICLSAEAQHHDHRGGDHDHGTTHQEEEAHDVDPRHYGHAAEQEEEDDDGDDPSQFCGGRMSMVIFMDGFHRSLRGKQSCLNYFVATWRLTDRGKFRGACVFTVLLGILIEGLSAARAFVVRRSAKNLRRKHWLLTAIYAVQAPLGYMLMLISMSFSVELFLSVLVGLAAGNMIFIRYEEEKASAVTAAAAPQQRRNPRGNDETAGPALRSGSPQDRSGTSLRRRS